MRTRQAVPLAYWQRVPPTPAACIACIAGVSGMLDVADAAALGKRCARLTPRIERHAHALVLDLTGCERLVLTTVAADPSDHRNILHSSTSSGIHTRVAEALARVAGGALKPSSVPIVPTQIGVASTRTLAWLAASCHIPTPESPSASPSASICWRTLTPAQIAPFPLTTLRSLPDLVSSQEVAAVLAALDQSGIRTLGQLVRLSPGTLCRRFGAWGAALALLAAGHDLAPLQFDAPDRWLSGRMCFHTPILAEHIPRAFIPLARRLAAILSQRQLATSAVGIVLQPDRGPGLHAQRLLGQPITSPAALLDHAQRLLAGLTAADGARGAGHHTTYHSVQLRVGDLCAAVAQQPPLWALERPDWKIQHARCIELLTAICSRTVHDGRAGLLRTALSSPHAVLPEDRYTLLSMTEGAP